MVSNNMAPPNTCTISNNFHCNNSFNHPFLADVVLLINKIVLCAAYLKYSSQYCNVMHCMSIKYQKYFVSQVVAMQFVSVRTAASSDDCPVTSYESLTQLFTAKLFKVISTLMCFYS